MRPSFRLACAGVAVLAVAISGISPHDRLTWWMEVAPVLLALPLLFATGRRLPLSSLSYGLLAVHAVILCVGGHYTYAEVPAGFWVKDLLHLPRNPYDGLGHFVQGFIPAVVAREVLLATSPLRRGRWLTFLVVCVCLAFSSLYELIEWAAAVGLGQGADAFLGAQGDPWDTQKDMALALLGASLAMLLTNPLQDRFATPRPAGAPPRPGAA